MSSKHTYVTKSEQRRAAKKKKKAKTLRTFIIAAVCVLAVVFGANAFINGMYQHGGKVDSDIRTADELKGDVMNILVCGIDWNEGRTSANTDVIMYVTLDIKSKKVSAFQIPRDTYIGEDVNTGNTGKINAVYGKNGSDNPIMDVAKILNSKLNLSIDHYVTLDMDAFINVVNGIDGGLDMYVPCPITLKDKATGREETIIPEAGWYKVDGALAEQIVRNRNYPNADVYRLEVQRYFYAAVIKYFTENTSVSDFIKIMSRFTQYLTTDMDWKEIASIAQFGFSVDYNDMVLVKPQLHGYDVIKTGKNSATNVIVPVEDNWAELLNTYCRPYQNESDGSVLQLPTRPPAGQVVRDYGITESSITTIGELLNNAGPRE